MQNNSTSTITEDKYLAALALNGKVGEIKLPEGEALRRSVNSALTNDEWLYCENIANTIVNEAIDKIRKRIANKEDPIVVITFDLLEVYDCKNDKVSALGVKMKLLELAKKESLIVLPIGYNSVIITL